VFKLKRKTLVRLAVFICLFLSLATLAPLLRKPSLDTLKYPLTFLSLIKREIAGIFFYHRNLIQNEKLIKEIDLLKQRLNAMQELSLENKRLNKLLSLKEQSPYKVIAARVIGRSADNWSSTIILDKGRYNGIKEGMVVINYLGLVGRVIETAISTSKVMLINDSNFAVSALVQRSRQEGLACGRLGSSLVMRYLSKDADIQPNDIIITSGLTDLYPKGLMIGKVTELGEDFSGLSRYAVIEPAVELSSIEEVLVIVK